MIFFAIFVFPLGVLFVSCFSYFVLLFYFQARKPEQLIELKEQFLTSCRQLISTPSGTAQHHLSIAEAFSKLSNYLEDFEWNFYKLPPFLQFLSPWISRFSAFCYWEDVFKIKQLLLSTSVDEHLKQIRTTPTDLEVHASLANTYVSLAKLHRESRRGSHHSRMERSRRFQFALEERSQVYSRLAMEEFKILSQYAPNDPWVHEQLAAGFKDLNLPEEEVKEMEHILQLRPQDRDILFRLGKLYFQQGLNAKGLKVYEELQKAHYTRAGDLISSYGAIAFKTEL